MPSPRGRNSDQGSEFGNRLGVNLAGNAGPNSLSGVDQDALSRPPKPRFKNDDGATGRYPIVLIPLPPIFGHVNRRQ